jgi:hypothetical protein
MRRRKKTAMATDPRLLPKDRRRLKKLINAAEAVVAVVAKVKIAAVDLIEENENENGKALERTTGPSIPVLLDLYRDHILLLLRYLGHILQRRYPTRLLPLIIPENDGANEKPNVVAKDSTADLRREEISILKMNSRRINGRFLSLNWS